MFDLSIGAGPAQPTYSDAKGKVHLRDRSRIALDPFKNNFDDEFQEYDWTDFYGDI